MNLRSVRTRLAFPIFLLFAVLVAHGGALRADFLYDDYHSIAENPAVLTHAWGAIWTSTEAGSRDAEGGGRSESCLCFRPVTLSSYAIDYAVGKGRPAVLHATQVLLHAGAVMLVYLVATALGMPPLWAAAAALLAGVHPVQTEAVQYLSARSSVLSGLGLLASLWTYIQWDRRGTNGWDGITVRVAWRAASLGFLVVAVLSKESAVAGLIWFVAYDRLLARATWAQSVRRLGPHVAAAALSVAPAVLAVNQSVSGASVPTGTALATGMVLIARHLGEWLVVFGVEPVSPQSWVGWDQRVVWAAVALVVVVCAGGYWVRRRVPLVAWGIAAGIGALLPIVALPFITNVALFQPHRGYAAAVGLAIASAAAAEVLVRRVLATIPSEAAQRWTRVTGWAIGASLVLALVVTDARMGRIWRDEVVFWTAAVSGYPREAAYRQSLGAARLRAGDPSGAVEALTAAARLDPLLPRVEFNLGLAYARLGRYTEAVAAYERAADQDPTDVKALANLGVLYERNGAPDRAERAYRAALAVDPSLSAVRDRLARLDGHHPREAAGGQ